MNAFGTDPFEDLDLGVFDLGAIEEFDIADVFDDKSSKRLLLEQITLKDTLHAKETLEKMYTIDEEIISCILDNDLPVLFEHILNKFPEDALKACNNLLLTFSSEKAKKLCTLLNSFSDSTIPFLLHSATHLNLLHLVTALIEHGVSLEKQDQSLQTPLIIACQHGHKELIQFLLSKGADGTCYDSIQVNAFMYARNHDDKDVVNIFLSREESTTIWLSQAIIHGFEDVVERILHNQFKDVELLFIDPSILNLVIERGSCNIARNFIEAGCFIRYKTNNGENVCHTAAKFDRRDLLELFKVFEIDIDAPNEFGETPLLVASKHGNLNFIQGLIEHKVNLTKCNSNKSNCLHISCAYGHKEVAQFFLESNINVNSKNRDGGTVLHTACARNQVEIAKILLEQGFDINAKDNYGYTPLHDAANFGSTQACEFLLKANANIHARNSNGTLPFHRACAHGLTETAQIFLDYGLDIDSIDNNGNTPLHEAAKRGNEKTASFLLSAKANPNITNKNGDTPLLVACEFGKIEIVELLLGYGIDLYSKNKEGLNCLFNAEKKGNKEIVDFFISPFCKAYGISFDTKTQKLSDLIKTLEEKASKIVESGNEVGFNPLEICLLLQSRSLAKSFARLMKPITVFEFIAQAREKYPISSDTILDLFLSLHPSHFHLGHLQYDKIPEAPTDVNIDDYLKIVDTLNFTDPSKDDYIDPKEIIIDDVSKNPEDLKKRVAKYIKKVREKSVTGMTSDSNKTRDDYYTTIESALKHIFKKIQSSDPASSNPATKHLKLFHVAKELASASGYCSAPYLQVPMKLYRKYCLDLQLSFEDEFYHGLRLQREIALESMCSEPYVKKSQSVHALQHFKHTFAKQLGLFFSKEGYDDQYKRTGFHDAKIPSKKEMLQSFKKFYRPNQIVDVLLETISDPENKSKYLVWLKSNLNEFFQDQQERTLSDLRKKTEDLERALTSHYVKKKEMAKALKDGLPKLDLEIYDLSKKLQEYESELQSSKFSDGLDKGIEDTEHNIRQLLSERESTPVENTQDHERIYLQLSEQKKILKEILQKKLDQTKASLGILFLEKIKMTSENNNRLDSLIDEQMQILFDLEQKLISQDPMAMHKASYLSCNSSSEGKIVLDNLIKVSLSKFKKLQQMKDLKERIHTYTDQLLSAKNELESLGGMFLEKEGFSTSVKEELEDMLRQKFFDPESLKPKFLYLLTALEKLNVIRV